jgi:hypothetical protein
MVKVRARCFGLEVFIAPLLSVIASLRGRERCAETVGDLGRWPKLTCKQLQWFLRDVRVQDPLSVEG